MTVPIKRRTHRLTANPRTLCNSGRVEPSIVKRFLDYALVIGTLLPILVHPTHSCSPVAVSIFVVSLDIDLISRSD